MIIWSGRGILSILVPIATFILMVLILPDKVSDHGLIFSLYFAGIFSWVFGNRWNRKRFYFDEATGKLCYTKNRHTLFCFPIQFWGIIFLFIAIIIKYQKEIWIVLFFSIMLIGYFIYFYGLQNKKMVVTKEEVIPTIIETKEEMRKRSEEKEVHE